MAASRARFLKPEILSRLKTMELRAATVVEGVLTGLHRSPFRGFSIEFAEYRRYQPGDDLKRIDWKAYARSDRFYIKEFEDETNLDAYLILDASASMGFGSNGMTKWQYAGILAASLAYIFQRQKDAAALVVMDEDIRVEMPPRCTRGHLIQLIGQMESVEPARKTSLAHALHRTAARIRRKGMVILISDLLDEPEEIISGLRHLQFGGNDVVVLQTLDALELGFDFNGPHLFLDPETNRVIPALAEDVQDGYRERLGAFLDCYAQELGRSNIFHTVVNTSNPLDETLLWFLSRNARIRGSR